VTYSLDLDSFKVMELSVHGIALQRGKLKQSTLYNFCNQFYHALHRRQTKANHKSEFLLDQDFLFIFCWNFYWTKIMMGVEGKSLEQS
jgi:hypothetical protein